MSNSAKLRMRGNVLLIISCLLLSAIVCFIWLAVLINLHFLALAIILFILFYATITNAVYYFLRSGKCMKNHIYERSDEN